MSAVKEMQFTEAWGLNAGTGQMVVLGAVLPAGSPYTLTIGGKSIAGIVTRSVEHLDTSGVRCTLDIADNRIRLTWDYIACQFNHVEIVPLTPASDMKRARNRYYWHIYPADFLKQKKTYTRKPHTAKEILDKVFAQSSMIKGGSKGTTSSTLTGASLITGSQGSGPTIDSPSSAGGGGSFTWTYVMHASLNQPVYNLDAGTGMELGNFIQQICDRLGIVMGLAGPSQLKFTVKGTGTLPSWSYNTKVTESGSAISQNRTTLFIIGDRNIYQDTDIALTKDWKSGWEQYSFEPDFLDMVDTKFGPFGTGTVNRAKCAAKSREVTVRQVATAFGDASLLDYGRYKDTIRNELPAWFYIRQIVWKAYRVPSNYQFRGIPLLSLGIKEGLLKEVTFSPTAGTMSYLDGGEYYPDSRALIIAQGQPIDLFDPARKDFVDPATFATLSTLWRQVSRFSVDTKNWVFLFDECVIQPGTGDDALFRWLNSDNSSVPATHPSKYLVAPNADADITAATVKASLAFEAERYTFTYGSGKRRASLYVSGLAQHSILTAGASETEIQYDTDPPEYADDKAQKAAAAAAAWQEDYACGSFQRRGTGGTTLTGVIDRVTTKLDTNGLSEDTEFTKERGPNYFDSERELERRKQVEELFPGQREMINQAREFRFWGKLAELTDGQLGGNHPNAPTDLLTRPPAGGVQVLQAMVSDEFDAGSVLWHNSDAATPGASGPGFAGVVAIQTSNVRTVLAMSGVVPVRCKGSFKAGETAYCADGETFCTNSAGGKLVGAFTETFTGDGVEMVSRVMLGAGAAVRVLPFDVEGRLHPETHNPEVRVSVHSRLLKDFNNIGSTMDIDHLDGWLPISDGQVLILYLDTEADPMTSEILVCTPGDGTWERYPEVVKWDDPYAANKSQVGAYVLIGFITSSDDVNEKAEFTLPDSEGDPLRFIRCLYSDLMIDSRCEDGANIIYPRPWMGGKIPLDP